MRRVIYIVVAMLVFFSVLYVIAEQQGWLAPEVVEARIRAVHNSRRGQLLVSLAVIGLLLIDILLPIPSSVVMVAAGKFLGPWLGGSVSFLGAMLAAALGFYACRLGGQGMFKRLIGQDDCSRVTAWFRKYGVYAIILSRSVPMLTEILSCLAGLSKVRARTFFAAAVLGTLPICFVYSYFGSIGEPTSWLPLLVAFVIPAAGWLLVRRIKREPDTVDQQDEVDPA